MSRVHFKITQAEEEKGTTEDETVGWHHRHNGREFEQTLGDNARKVMLKILQARLQQYVNRELPGVQAGFRKGRGNRDQIANIRWIMEKA